MDSSEAAVDVKPEVGAVADAREARHQALLEPEALRHEGQSIRHAAADRGDGPRRRGSSDHRQQLEGRSHRGDARADHLRGAEGEQPRSPAPDVERPHPHSGPRRSCPTSAKDRSAASSRAARRKSRPSRSPEPAPDASRAVSSNRRRKSSRTGSSKLTKGSRRCSRLRRLGNSSQPR